MKSNMMLLYQCIASLAFLSLSFNIVNAANVWPVYVGSESTVYDLQNLPVWAVHRFYPSNLTIASGDSIVFVYKTHGPHTVTWTDNIIVPSVSMNGSVSPYVAPINYSTNSSSLLHVFDGKKNFSTGARNNLHRDSMVTFTSEGSYKLYCILHPHMQIQVTVSNSAASSSNRTSLSVPQLTTNIWNEIDQDRLRMNQYLYRMNLSFVNPLPSFSNIDQTLKQLNASSKQESIGTGLATDGEYSQDDIQGVTQSNQILYSKYNFTTIPANLTSFPNFGLGCNETMSSNQTGIIQYTSGKSCPNQADLSSMQGAASSNTSSQQQCLNHNILTGVDIMYGNVTAASNRFYPSFLTIQLGDTVTFNSSYSFSPHIVIFNNTGIEGQPQLIEKTSTINEFGAPNMAFNTSFLTPIQNATFGGVGVLSSGLLLSRSSTLYTDSPLRLQIPSSFTLTFNQVGVYRFVDAIQAQNGMVGWIHVKQNRTC